MELEENKGCPPRIDGLDLVVRKLESTDLKEMFRLVSAYWDTFFQDLVDCYQVFPKAFSGVFLKERPTHLICVCVGAKWKSGVSYLTWYVTDPQYQKKGLGSYIFNLVLNELKDSNVVLDAVQGTQNLYHKYGFSEGKVILTWKWSVDSISFQRDHGYVDSTRCVTVEETLTNSTLDAIHEFDKSLCSEEDRRTFWQVWLTSPASTVKIAMKSGKCVGLAVGRTSASMEVVRISPLYAESKGIACLLLQEIMLALKERYNKFYVCYPDFCSASVEDVLHSIGVTENLNTDEDEISMSQKPINFKNKNLIYSVCMDSVCIF